MTDGDDLPASNELGQTASGHATGAPDAGYVIRLCAGKRSRRNRGRCAGRRLARMARAHAADVLIRCTISTLANVPVLLPRWPTTSSLSQAMSFVVAPGALPATLPCT